MVGCVSLNIDRSSIIIIIITGEDSDQRVEFEIEV